MAGGKGPAQCGHCGEMVLEGCAVLCSGVRAVRHGREGGQQEPGQPFRNEDLARRVCIVEEGAGRI